MRIFKPTLVFVTLALAACGDDSTGPSDALDATDSDVSDTINDGLEVDTSVIDATDVTDATDATIPDVTDTDDTNDGNGEDVGPDTAPDTELDTSVSDVSDATDATDATDVSDATDVTDAADATDAAADSTPDATDATGEVIQPVGTSAQIQALLDAGTATPVTLDILVEDATVTLTKPAIGAEAAGFFIQGEKDGPAIFVAYSGAATVTRNDIVTFRATTVTLTGGISYVSALTDLEVGVGDGDADALLKDVSDVDLAASYASLANEHIALSGTIASDFAFAGEGFVSAQITTDGSTIASDGVRLRLPEALADELAVGTGCLFEVSRGAMWRFLSANGSFSQAQPSVFEEPDIFVVCDGPKVSFAAASSATEVIVSFDKALDPTTVNAAAFTISGGLTVSAAVVTGDTVKLTTSSQTAGTTYTVTVATAVTDTAGRELEASARTATFSGFAGLPKLVINEIDYDQPDDDSAEFIEIYNPGEASVDLNGFSLQLINGDDDEAPVVYKTFDLAGTVTSHGYAVIAAPAMTVTADVVIRFAAATNNIQNGPRDGVRIVTTAGGIVIDALLYEVQLTADPAIVAYGEGAPIISAEDNDAPNESVDRCPNGADTNDNTADFALSETATPGAANTCPAE